MNDTIINLIFNLFKKLITTYAETVTNILFNL